MHRDHSIIACLHHIYMGVIHGAHSVHGESHIQCNANQEIATLVHRPEGKLHGIRNSQGTLP